jgi:hypothetical protein
LPHTPVPSGGVRPGDIPSISINYPSSTIQQPNHQPSYSNGVLSSTIQQPNYQPSYSNGVPGPRPVSSALNEAGLTP